MSANSILFLAFLSMCLGMKVKSAWNDLVERQCNSCKCMGSNQIPLDSIKHLINQKRYTLMRSRMRHRLVRFKESKLPPFDGQQPCLTVFKWKFITKTKFVYKYLGDNTGFHQINSCTMQNDLITCSAPYGKINQDGSEHKENTVNLSWTEMPVWADEENILFTSCVGKKGYGTWALTSTKKKLSKEVKNIVLYKVKQLGFDPSKALMTPKHTC